MALFENGFKLGTPILLGIGVMILAPVALPIITAAVKPLAKATIKGGLSLIQMSRELISEVAETFEDITAEVKTELIAERAGTAANPSTEEVA